MTWITTDYTPTIVTFIMARQTKTVIEGVEIILPKQGYNMTYKERLRDAERQAKEINELLN